MLRVNPSFTGSINVGKGAEQAASRLNTKEVMKAIQEAPDNFVLSYRQIDSQRPELLFVGTSTEETHRNFLSSIEGSQEKITENYVLATIKRGLELLNDVARRTSEESSVFVGKH